MTVPPNFMSLKTKNVHLLPRKKTYIITAFCCLSEFTNKINKMTKIFAFLSVLNVILFVNSLVKQQSTQLPAFKAVISHENCVWKKRQNKKKSKKSLKKKLITIYIARFCSNLFRLVRGRIQDGHPTLIFHNSVNFHLNHLKFWIWKKKIHKKIL
jgi:hypothetical protein